MGELEDKAKGKMNQIKGIVTGDDATKMKGELQEKKGELKGAFERGKARVKDAIDQKE